MLNQVNRVFIKRNRVLILFFGIIIAAIFGVGLIITNAQSSTSTGSSSADFYYGASGSSGQNFCYNWKKDLSYGMTNDADIKALQTALTKSGVYSGPVTGNFYSLTQAAVKNFQGKYGIDQTGYVGPKTRAKLNELYGCGVSAVSTSTVQFTKDLTIGSTGNDVRALQQILINEGYLKISEPTGYFGSQTKEALIEFQVDRGISPALGYFGPKTREYFNSVYSTPSAAENSTSTATSTTSSRPSVYLKAGGNYGAVTIKPNTSTTLSWNSYRVDTCLASNDWLGEKPISGSELTDKIATGTKFYVLTCSGPGGAASSSVRVYTSASTSTYKGIIPVLKPRIDSVMPGIVSTGYIVKISGEGFAPHGNTINTSYHDYKDIDSDDGKTLYFPAVCPSGTTFPVDVSVENENGKSNEKTIVCS